MPGEGGVVYTGTMRKALRKEMGKCYEGGVVRKALREAMGECCEGGTTRKL